LKSLDTLDRLLRQQRRWLRYLLAFGALCTVGTIDHLSGYELSFSIFYLVPVSLAAWYLGPLSGRLFSAASALTWLWADLASGHLYSQDWIPFWNALMRFGFFLLVATLLERLRQAILEQQRLARRDALTGLHNGRSFRELGELLLAQLRRAGGSLTLAYIDLDHFKRLNDSAGHAEGDRALAAIGAVLRRSIRQADLAARLGGDEFAVLLANTGLDEADRVLDHLRRELQAEVTRQGWPIGFSVGAMVAQAPLSDLEQLLSAADALMYQVKHAGKGATRIASYPQSRLANPGA